MVLGINLGFECGFKGWMYDFYVNFKSRVRIFIMILEVDRDLMGATEPTWMYIHGSAPAFRRKLPYRSSIVQWVQYIRKDSK